MADLKISQLTSATLPLAGTEVLPIVQSSSTKKVSVADLTAGRAVAMAGGSFTDNITQGTAAKGINFTANTPRAGMTSQLLNWYEEGTFTPTAVGITVVSGTPVYTGKFTRIGRQVTVDIVMTNLSGTITIAAGNSFGSLPYSSATTSWGVYGDPGNAAQGGFCTVSGGSVYFATANTYTNYFSLTITYSV